MEGLIQDPQQLFDYDVVADGDKIGSVDNVWVDDDTGRPEFVSVKTGWIFGHSHIIPVTNANFGDKIINVPFTKDQISNAPTFSGDEDLSPETEQQIFDYYGMQSTGGVGQTGYGTPGGAPYGAAVTQTRIGADVAGYEPSDTAYTTAGVESDATNVGTTGGLTEEDLSETGTVSVPLSEEELQVGKREVQSGRIRLRKVVRTETRQVPVELRREEIQIERIPADEVDSADPTQLPADILPDAVAGAFQEDALTIPLMEEQPVVTKEAHVVGGVRVSKTVETETQTVSGEVRSEDVDIDRSDQTENSVAGRFEGNDIETKTDAGS